MSHALTLNATVIVLTILVAPARAQMDLTGDVPSLTGAREAEMLGTYAFAKERPRMYAPLPLLHLPLTPYTEMDDEHPWSEVRVDAALQYARHTLGRCGIVLDRGPLGRAPLAHMARPNPKLLRGSGHGETLVYFIDDAVGKGPGGGRAIGNLEASKTRYPFATISVEDDIPVLTVLPHIVGLRLNATVSDRPYSMMLNDRTLLETFGPGLAGAAGFFDPRRFGFSDEECNVMREALLRETQCAPRAYVYGDRGYDPGTRYTVAERRAARRGRVPWPFGAPAGGQVPGGHAPAPDDLVVAPTFANDGLLFFALHEGLWRGAFWRYGEALSRGYPSGVEIYRGFEQPSGLGLAVHPGGDGVRLLTFAEGSAVQVHTTSWMRESRARRPVRLEVVPCRVFLTSGPVGQGEAKPLAIVCHDRVWRLWKGRDPEEFRLPREAKWASMARRCNDDALLWLGTDAGPELWRVPAFGPLEQEPLPPWAAWPAAREVPFSATWGGIPRSLDRVNQRRFDASQTPRWLPAVNERAPEDAGMWVRFEDVHGPGWLGFHAGELRVE